MSAPLLDVQGLRVRFGNTEVLHGVDFQVHAGERVALVGESGAGKSMVAFAILGLLSAPGRISGGQVVFMGDDLVVMPPKALHRLRGRRIAMVFQDPMMTLNPVLSIGTQLMETLQHPPPGLAKVDSTEARQRAIDALAQVQIPDPQSRLRQYPHELSGGMRQRVVIAMALLQGPQLIIADEPTTALDVTIQADIMDMLVGLCDSRGMALLLITHDLAVVAESTQRALVMYAGRVIESGDTAQLTQAPAHPYTDALLRALPQMAAPGARLANIEGTMPDPGALPSGCAFHPRCPHSMADCRQRMPDWYPSPTGGAACHLLDPLRADNGTVP